MSLLFKFVQFEFTHAIGPHAGRYVVERVALGDASDDDAAGPRRSRDPALDARNRELAGVTRGVGGSDVLVVGVVGAPTSKRRLLRKARPIAPEAAPAEVPLSLVTFVKGTQPLSDGTEAANQLDAIRFSEADQQRWVDEGLKALNAAVRAYRVGAPDPYAFDVTRRDARRIRIGYGTTADVSEGRWRKALELPPPASGRRKLAERLRPAEAVAAVLSGKSEVLEAEELLLRALIDLDHGRTRAAAYQVAGAMRLMRAELESNSRTDGLDVQNLAARAQQAEQLVGAAAVGPLAPAQVEELESIIEAVVDRLDQWRYGRAGS
jgi:hypothetical protein